MRQHLALLVAAVLTTSCSAPGLRETVSTQEVIKYRKLVVVSAIGDKITYWRQGWVKGDKNTLVYEDSTIDDVVVKRAQAVVSETLGLEVQAFSDDKGVLFSLYNGAAAPGNAGLEFGLVRSEFLRIFEKTNADAMILIFKGVKPLPGGMGGPGFWVQGAAISNMRDNPCALTPNAMISIIPKDRLEPIASNGIPSRFILLPEEICEGKLEAPANQFAKVLQAATLQALDESAIRSGFTTLLAK